MFVNPTSIYFLLLLASNCHGYKISLYQGIQCRGGPAGTVVAGPDQGCLTEGAGVALSATVTSTGPVDDNFAIAFFSSRTCDPGTEIWHSVDIMSGDDGAKTRCFPGMNDKGENVNFGSYQIWDLSKPGAE